MARRRIPAGAWSTLFLAALVLLALAWLAAGTARAALPGENGRIAFTTFDAWSPDIWVTNPDGSEPTRLTCGGRSAGPSWSPDGQKVAFGRGVSRSRGWVMDADGRNPRRVSNAGPRPWPDLWSPTSERLTSTVLVSDYPEWRVDVVNADGSGHVSSLSVWEPLTRQAWSPDGRRLVADGRIFEPDTGRLRTLPGLQPAWSSRDQIAFLSFASGGPDLWKMNPDGSREVQLTDDSDFEEDPLWSPDGGRMAFLKVDIRFGESRTDLWVMDADGANEALLAADIRGGSHTWSPDGERIAFLRENYRTFTTELWVTGADGANQTLLARERATGRRGMPLHSHAWSPDGRRIVFVKQDFISGESKADVWVVNADTGDEAPLAEGAHMPDWQPLPAGGDLGPPPSQFCFGRVRRYAKLGLARLKMDVPRPGRVILHNRPRVKKHTGYARVNRDEGTIQAGLSVRPTGTARRRLNRKNRVRVRAQVTYRPYVGEPLTKGRQVWLVKR